MARARLLYSAFDSAGNAITNRAVTVLDSDGVSVFPQVLYDAASGGAVITAPTTSSIGELTLYADTPQRCKLLISGVAGQYDGEFFADPSLVMLSTGASVSHLTGIGSTPTLTLGLGAGTSPGTSFITGSDMRGTLTLTTGTAPLANVIVATITFAVAFPAGPRIVLLTGGNLAAKSLAGGDQVWVDIPGILAGSWALRANNPLAATTIYQWYYLVVG